MSYFPSADHYLAKKVESHLLSSLLIKDEEDSSPLMHKKTRSLLSSSQERSEQRLQEGEKLHLLHAHFHAARPSAETCCRPPTFYSFIISLLTL